jgi:hypothetical protein
MALRVRAARFVGTGITTAKEDPCRTAARRGRCRARGRRLCVVCRAGADDGVCMKPFSSCLPRKWLEMLTSGSISSRLGRGLGGIETFAFVPEDEYGRRNFCTARMTEEPPRKRRKQQRDGTEDGSKDAPLNKKAQRKLQNLADPSALPQVFLRFASLY